MRLKQLLSISSRQNALYFSVRTFSIVQPRYTVECSELFMPCLVASLELICIK